MSEKFYGTAENCVFLQTVGQVQVTGTDGVDHQVAPPLLAKKVDGAPGKTQYEYVELTKTEGFILRLLLQALPTSLVTQALIWKSSGQLTGNEADSMVQSVITRYMNAGYIQAKDEIDSDIQNLKLEKHIMLGHHQQAEKAQKAASQSKATKQFTRLDLNASINPIGWPIIRLPWPPMQ
jgi:hypothetical protein